MTAAKVEPKVVHATGVVERSFSKPAGLVFAALSDPNKVRQWMGGNEYSELLEFACEFRPGGKQVVKYKMGPGTPIAGGVITNEGRFQQIVLGERVVTVSTMKMNDLLISSSQVTFELVPTEKGTDLILTHQDAFFEGSDGPEMRDRGWNVLLDKLVTLVNEQ
jgi:uncharacterized protein YndB with AHSA1/START domain